MPMDIDPLEIAKVKDEAERPARNRWLNPAVGVAVALLATFMGICKVKDDNIVQAMQQAQADKLDHWNFYQARNIRQDVAEASVTQLKLARLAVPADKAAGYDEAIQHYQAKAVQEAQKKQALSASAAEDQKNYDSLNYRDDQFDLSDAALAIAISLLAVTALTRLWWMYWLSWLPIGAGVLMGLSGLLGWAVHPDTLTKLLS
ncbi:MAG TPA: DUF4337 domain-containing protein [Ramlibacter sp.]|nr:DUF4337 domain-containing protein [Ramlibacter sp.]